MPTCAICCVDRPPAELLTCETERCDHATCITCACRMQDSNTVSAWPLPPDPQLVQHYHCPYCRGSNEVGLSQTTPAEALLHLLARGVESLHFVEELHAESRVEVLFLQHELDDTQEDTETVSQHCRNLRRERDQLQKDLDREIVGSVVHGLVSAVCDAHT